MKTYTSVLNEIKKYFPNIVLGEGQFKLNQQAFKQFIEYLQKDSNPSELLEMIKENNGISVQKMQFLNQHYKELWLHLPYRKETFDEKFENKIPFRSYDDKPDPSDTILQKFPPNRRVLKKYFSDITFDDKKSLDDEIQNMIKTKKMLPHYRYLLEKCNVSLKDSVDLREFLKFCYGESQGLQVKDFVLKTQTDGVKSQEKTWYLNHNSNEGSNITLYDFLYQKNGCQPLDIDPIMYDALARNYQGPKKDNFVVF